MNSIEKLTAKLVDKFVETINKKGTVETEYFTCNTNNVQKYMYSYVRKLIPSIMKIPCENIDIEQQRKTDQKIFDNLHDIATQISFKIFKTIPTITIDIDNDDISSYCLEIISIIIDFKKSYNQIYSCVNQIYAKFIEKFKHYEQKNSKFIKIKYEYETDKMKEYILDTLTKFIPIMKNIIKEESLDGKNKWKFNIKDIENVILRSFAPFIELIEFEVLLTEELDKQMSILCSDC